MILAFSTCGSAAEAERIARHLVDARVAACVSITPGVRSIYRWQDKVHDDTEWALTIKTRRDLFPRLREELRSIHSYETPELIALRVLDGLPDYLAWVTSVTAPQP